MSIRARVILAKAGIQAGVWTPAFAGVTRGVTPVVAGMTLMLAVARGADAQTTTRSGVYSAAQADRGADVYAGMCRSCHTAASHTGVTFAKWWKGRTLAELFAYVSERMPKNDPASLTPEQYADVVAYLLRLNAMPPGSAEMVPDSTALAAIRIDVPDSAGAAPVKKEPRRR